MKVVPLRLQAGDDLRRVLEAWMSEQQEQAGCVISAVGSLSVAMLHIAIADSSGVVIGGHLCPGLLVHATAIRSESSARSAASAAGRCPERGDTSEWRRPGSHPGLASDQE
jgi:hypothetical protein